MITIERASTTGVLIVGANIMKFFKHFHSLHILIIAVLVNLSSCEQVVKLEEAGKKKKKIQPYLTYVFGTHFRSASGRFVVNFCHETRLLSKRNVAIFNATIY